MATEEPNPLAMAAPEDGIPDFGVNGCDSAAEAAAAAAAVAAQLAAGANGESPSHAFSTLFFVDFTFLKAGNLMEVVE